MSIFGCGKSYGTNQKGKCDKFSGTEGVIVFDGPKCNRQIGFGPMGEPLYILFLNYTYHKNDHFYFILFKRSLHSWIYSTQLYFYLIIPIMPLLFN